MKKYKAVIFDFDDTLVQTFNHVMDVIYPTVAQEHNIKFLGKEVALAKWGSDLDVFFNAVFEGHFESKQLLDRMTEIQRASPPPPFKETISLLNALKEKKVFIGIYTSGIKSITENTIIHSLKLSLHDFSLVFCTPEYKVKKPTSLVISEIQNKYKRVHSKEIKVEDMLFVGDGLSDFITAKDAGSDFIAVTSGVHKASTFIELGLKEEYIYKDINDAKETIAGQVV